MNNETVKTFFDAWSVYDLVLEQNYMFHNEIYELVGRTVRERFERRPFSLLDLGCGSARHLSGALDGSGIHHYEGCDLSDVALRHARKNMGSVAPRIELRQMNFMDALASSGDQFDLVFCSFALHHLTLADKERFFRLASRRVKPDGMLLVIDTAVEDDEDLEISRNAYCDWIKRDWINIPAEAKELIYNHIQSSDFPEKTSTLFQFAKQAGFSECRDLSQIKWHHTWSFRKNSVGAS
jgi:ubiquinone/menaquinone biosynthesis C-methylase UbiE